MKQIECNRLFLDGADDEEIARLLELPLSAVRRWRNDFELAPNRPTRKSGPALTPAKVAINQLKREGFAVEEIKQVFGAVALAVVLTASTLAQTHTPTLTIDGDTVTIDADICWHDPATMSLVRSGTTLGVPGVFRSINGSDPIILDLPPGTHTITALGFPDAPGSNLRNSATLTAVVGKPTRLSQLVEAYKNLLKAQNDFIAANAVLEKLQATQAEVIQALTALAGGT